MILHGEFLCVATCSHDPESVETNGSARKKQTESSQMQLVLFLWISFERHKIIGWILLKSLFYVGYLASSLK